LKKHEDICVFAPNGHTYNPVMKRGTLHSRGGARTGPAQVYGKFADRQTTENADYYPTSIVPSSTVMIPEHPTQKPVALLEYLLRTYTNEGDAVLDNTMGSGTTLVACIKTGRSGTGIELRRDYFEIAEERCRKARLQPPLTDNQEMKLTRTGAARSEVDSPDGPQPVLLEV
jgi:site-specific DNA-methyltransferase (adenine-specific)